MGVHVLHDRDARTAALYDSVTGAAFGAVFEEDPEHGWDAGGAAQALLNWLGPIDARTVSPDLLNVLREEWLDALASGEVEWAESATS